MVTIAAIALGREVPSRRKAAALTLASAGLALMLAGAAGASLTVLVQRTESMPAPERQPSPAR